MEENYIITFKWESRKRNHDVVSMFQYCVESELENTIKVLQDEGSIILSVNLIAK